MSRLQALTVGNTVSGTALMVKRLLAKALPESTLSVKVPAEATLRGMPDTTPLPESFSPGGNPSPATPVLIRVH